MFDSQREAAAEQQTEDCSKTPGQNQASPPPLGEPVREAKGGVRSPGPRSRDDRGLPADDAIIDLAKTYLETQHRLWPELIAIGVLPPVTEKTLGRLAEDFKRRFLTAKIDLTPLPDLCQHWNELGSEYLRYSCDNSNPRSLPQQLQLGLQRARQDKVFVPWECINADAAVTGTVAARRGYQMAKALIQNEPSIKRLYIDEIGRASRDAIEALRLGKLIDRCEKRLIGVSDGFDSLTPHAKMMLALFAMLHEWFVDQLRAKVRRGMADAFTQGRNIYSAAFGYKLVPATDKDEHPIYDKDGDQVMVKVIDDDEAHWVREVFRLLVEGRMSPEKIAQRFAESKVGGSSAWGRAQIVKMLNRELYFGYEFYGKSYQVRDSDTGKVTVKYRPREEWKRREVPHLRIISDEMGQKAQERLRECSAAYKGRKKNDGPSRTTVYPKTLFRPVCGYCGNELWLGRSGKYASFCCLNGVHHKHDCQLRTYKTVGILDNSLLNYLRDQIFTENYLRRLLTEANRFLVEEAKRPKEETRPLMVEIKKLKTKRDRLVKILEGDDEGDLEAIVDQVRRLERELKERQQRLKEIEKRNAAPPSPMNMEEIAAMVQDLRGLLAQDVAAAAPVLKELMGTITVTQAPEPGTKGTPWIAKFSVNAVPAIARVASQKGCPTTGTWEYLNSRGWTMLHRVEIVIESVLRYQRLAVQLKELADKGASVQALARANTMNWSDAKHALEFARTGKQRQPAKRRKKAGKRRTSTVTYRDLVDVVVQMRDVESRSFRCIAARLTKERSCPISPTTVRRAYDFAHADAVHQAAGRGEAPRLGRYSHLDESVFRKIREGLSLGKKTSEIAKEAGCSENTVRRERKRMSSQEGDAGYPR